MSAGAVPPVAPGSSAATTRPRSRLPWRRRRQDAAATELAALRGQVRALRSAATDLVADDDPHTVLDRLVARAAEAVRAPAAVLAVHPPAGGPPLVHGAGLSAAEAQDVAAALLDGRDPDDRVVVVDVASARRVHGRLAAVFPGALPGTGDEGSVLSAYAGHAAAALDLLLALADGRSQAARAAALLELAHGLAGSAGAAGVCDVVARALPGVVGCTSAAVLLWDPSTGLLQPRSSTGLDDARRDHLHAAGLTAEDTPEVLGLLSDREPIVLRPGTGSPVLRDLLGVLGLADLLAVPLVADGAFLGVVAAGWQPGQAPARLDGDVLDRLRGVGAQAATALARARLLETVRHQALHDALTGLPNRVLVARRLEAQLGLAGPDTPLAVLFCDLDRFKAVNDRLGHTAGDELLRQVAARLRAVVRPGDTVGRLGGDQFVLLLPDVTDLQHAEGLAERVADCFTEPFRLAGSPVRVRASIGLALHAEPDGDRRGEHLLDEADAAMHHAKRSDGRRRDDLPR